MSFPNSNFEGNFSIYVFGNSFWHNRELNIECWTSRQILLEKNIKIFRMCGVRNLVEEWNVYEGHIFPIPLLQTCRLETTSLCLNTRLFVNKNFQILIIFIEINLTFVLYVLTT